MLHELNNFDLNLKHQMNVTEMAANHCFLIFSFMPIFKPKSEHLPNELKRKKAHLRETQISMYAKF